MLLIKKSTTLVFLTEALHNPGEDNAISDDFFKLFDILNLGINHKNQNSRIT